MTINDLEHLREKPWNRSEVGFPEEIFGVTSMLAAEEKRMLYYVTKTTYQAQGKILDMGPFLGGSTICFATALRDRGFQDPLIHTYDFFRLGEYERKTFFPKRALHDLGTREVFEKYIRDVRHLIEVHEGDILNSTWDGGRVEVLFLDLAKTWKTMDHVVAHFFPALEPGSSLLIMQDYLWGTVGPWNHVVMEKLADYFEYLSDTGLNSVLFVPTKRIPKDVLQGSRWEAMSKEEKLSLMYRAIEKLDTEAKKNHLRKARELLLDGRDMTWGSSQYRF